MTEDIGSDPPRRAVDRFNLNFRLEALEQYARRHGETLSEHNNELAEIKTERAVAKERAITVQERFDRLEKKIDGIYSLGKWVLGAFGASFVALLANFLFKGGFS
jgi:hypothetical protein